MICITSCSKSCFRLAGDLSILIPRFSLGSHERSDQRREDTNDEGMAAAIYDRCLRDGFNVIQPVYSIGVGYRVSLHEDIAVGVRLKYPDDITRVI